MLPRKMFSLETLKQLICDGLMVECAVAVCALKCWCPLKSLQQVQLSVQLTHAMSCITPQGVQSKYATSWTVLWNIMK